MSALAEFATVQDYQAWMNEVVARLNVRYQSKYEQEKLTLQPLPPYRVPDYELVSARVSCHSTIPTR